MEEAYLSIKLLQLTLERTLITMHIHSAGFLSHEVYSSSGHQPLHSIIDLGYIAVGQREIDARYLLHELGEVGVLFINHLLLNHLDLKTTYLMNQWSV